MEITNSHRINFKGFFTRNKFTGTVNCVSWLVMFFLLPLCWLVFFVMNRVIVKGRENLPKQHKNVVLMSNHLSYAFDSLFIAIVGYFPGAILDGFYSPYHPTAYEHYSKNKLITFMGSHLRCIPVKRKWKNSFNEDEKTERFDIEGFNLCANALREGMIVHFPEGTRSKDGQIGEGRPGAGRLPYETKATVIPVRISGLEKILPKGAKFPKWGNKLTISYGKPVFLDDLYALPKSRETSGLIVERVMKAIKELD
jgi:1-acyl-sn-glycerol-3-phosphate acyltransferase